MKYNIDLINEVAIEAGKEIMSVYMSDDFDISYKDDNSPLTIADKKSNDIIVKYLNKYFPDVPIISEEEKQVDYDQRKDYEYYFCVDPLDGTKEFIKRNGEFTVNIALIRNRFPIFGVIYAPYLQTLYYGDFEKGAFKINTDTNIKEKIQVNKDYEDGLNALSSRSHKGNESEFFKMIGVKNTIFIGSALKFCLLAEGTADFYIRSNPTMEWDTAAGQAILEAAGGIVLNEDKLRFIYNKKSLLNGMFMCFADKSLIK